MFLFWMQLFLLFLFSGQMKPLPNFLPLAETIKHSEHHFSEPRPSSRHSYFMRVCTSLSFLSFCAQPWFHPREVQISSTLMQHLCNFLYFIWLLSALESLHHLLQALFWCLGFFSESHRGTYTFILILREKWWSNTQGNEV